MLNNMRMITGQREVRPVWNNAQRVNHQNKLTHPHPKRNFVPTAVLTKSGNVPVNTAKQNSPRASVSNSTARYVNSDASRPTLNGAKPSLNVFHKSHSSVKRNFDQRTAPKNSDFKETVNTATVNNVTTAGTKAVGNLQYALQDQGIFDSGCSRYMTGNKFYLSDYQDIDGGFVAFGGSSKGGKITRKCKIRTDKLNFEDVYFVKELKFNLFSVSKMCDKKNSVLFIETECLVLSPDFKLLDESQVLLKIPRHNNMYSFDLKNVVPLGENQLGVKGFQEIVDFLNGSHIRYALTKNPTIYVSLIEKFWQTATVRTVDNGEQEITATFDGKEFTITEASVRRHLQLADADGISVLPNTEIFDQLILTGYVLTDDKLTFQKGGIKCPMNHTLGTRVLALETDLRQIKKVYGTAYTKLIMKVKKLEKTVKTSQARRRTKIMVSDDDMASEDSSK
ncbi:hypothetical protein Tco_0620352 [Tanacetum coccineum]